MSISTALSNFMNWRERRQARNGHERLETVSDDSTDADTEDPQVLSEVEVSENPSANTPTPTGESAPEEPMTEPTATDREDEETGEATRTTEGASDDRFPDRVPLRELEEERELARRRTSVCLLLAIFLLFRLWIEALTQGDFGLLMICLVGTSWCARWVRHSREREEELDRRIAAYVEDGTQEVNRDELRMLSFQAQLALAIMESQRQMLNGGFGHPDGPQTDTAGVSEEAQAQWEKFEFKKEKKGPYDTVAQEDKGEEEPHCTICLGEYDDGDRLVKLPCDHVYHEECISSWTTNHVRCPLCNYDLESASSAGAEANA